MKNSIKIALLFLFSNPALLMAQSHTKKYEMYSIIGVMIALALFVIGFYYYLSNKKKKKSGDKYVVKTVESYRNGRKIIMTKKYRIVQDKEFPNELKRSNKN